MRSGTRQRIHRTGIFGPEGVVHGAQLKHDIGVVLLHVQHVLVSDPDAVTPLDLVLQRDRIELEHEPLPLVKLASLVHNVVELAPLQGYALADDKLPVLPPCHGCFFLRTQLFHPPPK